MDELESLRQQLEELKALRNRLAVDEEKVEEQEVVEEETTDLRKSLEEELVEIDKEIEALENEVKQTAKDYEESYKRLQVIVDEYEKKVGDTKLLSEEELEELRKTTENLKLEENERSVEIKRRLDAQKKIIRELKSKRTRIENDLTNAEALGLSYKEYKEITSTIRKTSIMNGILEEKGLSSIIEKKASERTQEEKDLLKKTKEEILNEISEFRKDSEYEDYSVLDIIEALYSLDTKYIRVEAPREIKQTSKELMVIEQNKDILPFKVINPNFQPTVEKVKEEVQEAPKDMENAQENEKVDINDLKPAEEKVTLFKDSDTNEFYVRKYAVDRFKLKSADLGNEVRINGSLCYKISETDVERIKENANNAFSPYIADVKEITLKKENTNEIFPEDTKDELIPGTNIKRPRDRGIEETDEEYEAFLKSYYDKVFPQEVATEPIKEETVEETKETYEIRPEDTKDELIPGTNIKRPRDRGIEETDEEYEAFLKKYYDKVFPQEEEKSLVVVPEKVEKSLMVVPQPEEKETEPIEEYKTVDEPIEMEYDPSSGIVYDFSKEELTDDDIANVVKEELNKEELTDDDIANVVNEELDKEEELTDDDIANVVNEELDKEEELTDDAIVSVVEDELNKTKPEEEKPKENKKLEPTNVKASEDFKKELKHGGILYNIVHKVPKVIATVIGRLESFFGKVEGYLEPTSVAGTKIWTDDLPRYGK